MGAAQNAVMHEPTVRKPTESRVAREHPRAFLAGYVVMGFLLAIAAAWAFSILADEIPERGWLVRMDSAVAGWKLAHETETGERIAQALSYVGSQLLWATVIVCSLIFAARRRWRNFLGLVVAGAGGAALN